MDRIITLSRQYGSRGRQVALLIGEKLGIPVYDREIIENASHESGIAVEHFEKSDEKRTSSFLFSLVSTHYGPATSMDVSNVINDDNLFLHTAAAIKRLSSGACIVVGRCADDVLKELNPLKIFICADIDSRVATICDRNGVNEKEAASMIKKADKNRGSYYNYYTGKEWGNPVNYDIVVNTGGLSVEQAADMIAKMLS